MDLGEQHIQEVPAFNQIVAQPRVKRFLTSAVASGRISHAYLFVGAPGAGKTLAAQALAQSLVCPHGGDAHCDDCIRVAHRTHPDVHWYSPAGVSDYLAGQIRELIDDVQLTPVRAKSKVYIIQRADMLHGTSANALLKTIEEPPAGVVFILIARTLDNVLPTIVSRCQTVPFSVLSPQTGARAIELACGIDDYRAQIALAITGTPQQAEQYLLSAARQEIRTQVIRAFSELAHADSWDILQAAQRIAHAISPQKKSKKKVDEAKLSEEEQQEAAIVEQYLSKKAQSELEAIKKREATSKDRSGMIEALAAAKSLLRDVLMYCEHVDVAPINIDHSDVIQRIGATTTITGVICALEAVDVAIADINHNVTPQLALEVMLLSAKEAL
ncbi:DNA polymerase III subunit [Atopobium fossor]|uniref:DNA polymerase III subunit n=1 Tax=Atopobium fossor TaxID=39487 RepID=UPI0004177038|nr:AAA family ATPase [Atopobium fossor]